MEEWQWRAQTTGTRYEWQTEKQQLLVPTMVPHPAFRAVLERRVRARGLRLPRAVQVRLARDLDVDDGLQRLRRVYLWQDGATGAG